MGLMTWSKELSVGHEGIDSQHQELINYINELHDAMKAGKGDAIMAPILDCLLDYTVNHFGFEEKLMKASAYPGATAHLEEHRKLKKEVFAFQENFKAKKMMITMDLMKFLKDWLLSHILKVDKEFAKHLASKGMAA